MPVGIPGRSRRIAGVGLFVVFGCGELDPKALRWPDSDASVAFLLSIDRDDGTTSTLGDAFELEPEASALQRVALPPNADLLLVLFGAEAWQRSGFLPRDEALETATLRRGASRCTRGQLTRDGDAIIAQLDARELAHVYRAELDVEDVQFEREDPALLDGLELSLPIAPNTCSPFDASVWRTWNAAEPDPFRSGRSVLGRERVRVENVRNAYLDVQGLARVDETRLIAQTPAVLYLLVRGEHSSDAPGRAVDARSIPDAPPNDDATLFRLMLAPEVSATGARTVYAGMRWAVQGESVGGVVEIELGPEGFGNVRTATSFPDQLEDLVALENGEVLALTSRRPDPATPGRDSFVVHRPSSGAPWRRRSLVENERARVLYALPNADPPHLLGLNDGSVRRGDLRDPAQPFIADSVFLGPGRAVEDIGAFLDPEGAHVWAGSAGGEFARLEPGGATFEIVRNVLPPLLAGCQAFRDECGQIVNTAPIHMMTSWPGFGELISSVDGCDTLLAFDTRTECLRALPFPGQAPAVTPYATPVFSVGPSELIASTPDGRVLVWSREP